MNRVIHYTFEDDNNYLGEWYYTIDLKQIRDAIIDIYFDKYCSGKTGITHNQVKGFIDDLDIEEELYDILEDDIKEYFEQDAYQEFLNLK